MAPDIKTVIVFSSILITFMGLSLWFYRAYQKTYPGFGIWIIGTLVMAFGYQFLFLRSLMPIWINVLVTNIVFMLAAVLKWDSIARFLNDKSLPQSVYLTPILILAIQFYFYCATDNIIYRALALGVFAFATSLGTFREFIKTQVVVKGAVLKVSGAIYLLYGLLILARPIVWLMNPSSNIFNAGLFHGIYYILVTLFELALGISFLMMNGQRLEEELKDSKNELHDSVSSLEKAFSEIKTLSGLLPICASCKKIRDDKGYWNQIEIYIEQHSRALFSHGICPDCAEKLYKDTDWYQRIKKNNA